jgi:putative ABC transport system ATP-binding protein
MMGSGTNIVVTRDLRKEYRQGSIAVPALQGVDLTIRGGEFTALMGPSGSGKTTLLNIIGGLDEPTSGAVFVEGQDLAGLSRPALSDLRLSRIGFVFQAYNLIPVLSAYENAEFVLLLRGVPALERRARVSRVLADVGLEGMENRRPSELSGGQQQRVAVARAIAGEPALVLADEPTANLDSTTAQLLIDTMRKLNREQGITFLFATHDPRVQEGARRVVRLVDGRIAEDLRKEPG